MKTLITYIILAIAISGGAWYAYQYRANTADRATTADYKNISYTIDGETITLVDGRSEVETAPGSASKTITTYFGNELYTDLNNDGREDIVFLLTQETGGTGMFYYVVSALNTEHGYQGSDGYFLGDRIIPQSIEESSNPLHKNVIVIHYLDRAPDEPMATEPSISTSIYLTLDPMTMQWDIVPNLEGELQ